MPSSVSWTALDQGYAPGLDAQGGGRVVGVVATAACHRQGSGPRAAIELAAAWAGEGVRVMLADGALADPVLHELLGIDNGEGISDALTFGSSVRRVARRVEGQPFLAVAAGTPVADPAQAMGGGRWSHLCGAFRDAGVTLVVYLDGSDAATEVALREATDVVVVSGPDEEVPDVVNACGARLMARVGFASDTVPAAAAAVDAGDAPEEAAAVDATDASEAPGAAVDTDASDAPTPPGAGDPQSLVDSEPAPDPDASGEGDPEEVLFQRAIENAESEGAPVAPLEEILEESEAASTRGRGRLLLLVLLIVVAGVLAAAWFGWVEIPGITPTGGAAQTPDARPVPARAAVVSEPQGPEQAYSVALAAFSDPSTARAFVSELRRADSTALFFAEPVEADGRTLFRVVAGPAGDSADAEALREELEHRIPGDPSSWIVRPTPMAFTLGETQDLTSARRRAEVLEGLDVPAYVMVLSDPDGSARFRVYAGAFADEAEARSLADLLTQRGLNAARLEIRKGSLPE